MASCVRHVGVLYCIIHANHAQLNAELICAENQHVAHLAHRTTVQAVKSYFIPKHKNNERKRSFLRNFVTILLSLHCVTLKKNVDGVSL